MCCCYKCTRYHANLVNMVLKTLLTDLECISNIHYSSCSVEESHCCELQEIVLCFWNTRSWLTISHFVWDGTKLVNFSGDSVNNVLATKSLYCLLNREKERETCIAFTLIVLSNLNVFLICQFAAPLVMFKWYPASRTVFFILYWLQLSKARAQEHIKI